MRTNTTMKLTALAAAIGFVMSSGAFAAATVDQTIGYEVTAINEISVSGNIAAMTVNAATAGSQPDAVTNTATTYAITTNGTNKKITASIDSDMPDDVTLSLTAAAPTGGALSGGKLSLSTVAADVVTGITEVAQSTIGLSYELAATVTAGVIASATKTVTFTIVAGS